MLRVCQSTLHNLLTNCTAVCGPNCSITSACPWRAGGWDQGLTRKPADGEKRTASSHLFWHRGGTDSRLWNIISFDFLSVMDYRQLISEAAPLPLCLPPERFFIFYFLFWRAGGVTGGQAEGDGSSARLVTSCGFITCTTPPKWLSALAVTALHAHRSITEGLSEKLLEFRLCKHLWEAINYYREVVLKWEVGPFFFLASATWVTFPSFVWFRPRNTLVTQNRVVT